MAEQQIIEEEQKREQYQQEWQTRHEEKQQRVDAIRKRIQTAAGRYEENKQYFRPAKPMPSIRDTEEKRVAVYARVSTSSEEQTSSIENQSLYYTQKVEETPNWTLFNIYSDEGKSGTSMRHRDQFNQMMADAAMQKFDTIICASVSRFARNVEQCLDQIARLKNMNPSHPVGVYFETENIYTLDDKSDEALGIHALLADWESKNKSRRMILSYDQRIAMGQYPVLDLFGYRHTKEGQLIIQPDEADTVRFIYLSYLTGYGCDEIAEILTEKQRPTLQGRVDWTGGMVRNIMQNERRWGDLEARKTIVIDYKRGIIIKNNDQRCSAYVPGHHEGIVTPEIAMAARYIAGSSRTLEGIPEINLIDKGALKGFVSVHPAWSGIDAETYREVSKAAYEEEELSKVIRQGQIMSGKDHASVIEMDMAGYRVPYDAYFMSQSTPSLTISRKNIRFNHACYKKLGNCQRIELYYHPILKMLAVRTGTQERSNAFLWANEKGKSISIPAKGLSQVLYDDLNWREEFDFRFRGITKERGGEKIMFFYLEEPKILTHKKTADPEKTSGQQFVDYHKEADHPDVHVEDYAYPEEWKGHWGISTRIKNIRDDSMQLVTAQDIMESGIWVENPKIGVLPSRSELQEQREQLLKSM